MEDIEFINEHPEDNELFDIRPKQKRRLGIIAPFLVRRNIAGSESSAFKMLVTASILFFIGSALLFAYYQYGIDQLEPLPPGPKISSAAFANLSPADQAAVPTNLQP